MILSYNWLMDYLPVPVEPEKLSRILNSIGLEVESFEDYEEVKGGLEGLVIGKVLEATQHPNADKLSLTRVDIGHGEPLQIVCGAPNVAPGQTVVVAPVGATIYPKTNPPMTMRIAKIRGVESHGMICAEDEIGLGESHAGIMVIKEDVAIGSPAAAFFKPYADKVISIGLTPNRSDAMSHLGVARDICAWLNHHEQLNVAVKSPLQVTLPASNNSLSVSVSIENPDACPRYSGVGISGVKTGPSPLWMQQRLKAIGLRPINNIVDITNYILHETGQPLHAFDASQITGQKIIVKNLPAGTPFISLDEKERKLDSEDLMICNGNGEGMCIGGVFGGLHSGVSNDTNLVFLESAWFSPAGIRKSSFRHNLRTDAAMHFEKGVDISQTVEVLKRAAQLICLYANGQIASEVIDVYPSPRKPVEVSISYAYLERLSGKKYSPETVREILQALGFRMLKEEGGILSVAVPFHKTDISLPADIAEEIMRIDGFDNISIPANISFSPASETLGKQEALREKISGILAGMGFREMLNNSITNSAFYHEAELQKSVKMMNNLSAELDILRPSMLETGLQSVAHNLNRKNNNLQLFEFGKTYKTEATGKYTEEDHLALFITGKKSTESWKQKQENTDLFYLKGIIRVLFAQLGLSEPTYTLVKNPHMDIFLEGSVNKQVLIHIGLVNKKRLDRFDIRQETFYADLAWDLCLEQSSKVKLAYIEVPRFPTMYRDLAFVVDKGLPFEKIEAAVASLKIAKLKGINLFDVFESEKVGAGKKSMAMSFSFRDEEKTLTDEEVELLMQKIISIFEKELQAQIRR
jgi:phenylalanyl-tRNA synthetase beta chain